MRCRPWTTRPSTSPTRTRTAPTRAALGWCSWPRSLNPLRWVSWVWRRLACWAANAAVETEIWFYDLYDSRHGSCLERTRAVMHYVPVFLSSAPLRGDVAQNL